MLTDPTHKAAFKTHLLANTTPLSVNGGPPTPVNQLPNGPEEIFAIAVWYNSTATPPFFVFRTSVPVSEIMSNGFVWTQVDNATVGKARIWDWMTRLGSIDPSKPNIVAGINEAWSGAGNVAQRTAIFAHCQMAATNAQKILAVGAGTTASNLGVGPAVAVMPPIAQSDVDEARNN